MHFERKTSKLFKNVRHLDFLIFKLGIVINNLKNHLIFIFVQFERITSNWVKNGRHIESAILNFWPRNRNHRPQKPHYTHFCAIWTKNVEFSQKWPPYCIHHFGLFNSDCRIVISDLENRWVTNNFYISCKWKICPWKD